MAVSFFLHIFLLAAAGYLTAGLTAPLPLQEEVILEMDLMNDPAQRADNSPALPESKKLQDVLSPTPTDPMPIAEALPTEQEAVVTTDNLTMTEAEGPAVSSTSTQHSDGSSNANPSAITSTGSGRSRSSIVAPGILSKVDPAYPAAARQAGLEGTVVLRVQILTNGRPGEITVTRSTGHQTLDDAAVAAIGKWRFASARDRDTGKAVTCYTTLPVSFHLKDHK